MKIDEAIRLLQADQQAGVTDIIQSHWTPSDFDLENDDPDWPDIVSLVMSFDWSVVNNRVQDMVDEAINEE